MEQQLRANEAEERAKQAEQQLAEMEVLLKQYKEQFGDLQP
jgi:hypothetical protein